MLIYRQNCVNAATYQFSTKVSPYFNVLIFSILQNQLNGFKWFHSPSGHSVHQTCNCLEFLFIITTGIGIFGQWVSVLSKMRICLVKHLKSNLTDNTITLKKIICISELYVVVFYHNYLHCRCSYL